MDSDEKLEAERQKITELKIEWKETIELRDFVLDWAKRTGFNAGELVSRMAEHDLELKYGRKVLEFGEKQE